jgi:hypothetical protein
MTEYSFIVDHVTSATDISADVETITVNERGSGQICSAIIRLNSDRGDYMTTGSTIIDEFDKIRIRITDEDSVTFDKIYEVDNIIPIESSQEGNVIDVECLGFEHHLRKFFFSKPFLVESAFNVTRDIMDQYNGNKATLQPAIIGHNVTDVGGTPTNELPKWTANQYDFNLAEKKCYDGINDVIDKLGSTVANGGANDFFESYFKKHPTDDSAILFQGFISGSRPSAGNEITITDTDGVNGDPTEGGIGSTQGTVVASWGADGFGSQPVDTAKFAGELEAFFLDPFWESGVIYPTDARVQLDGVHYTKDIDTGTDTPPVNWTVKTVDDFLGTSQYSPWTEDKAAQFKDSGGDPSNTATGTFGVPSCWDSNMVVWDNDHYRTNVIKRINTNAIGVGAGEIPGQYCYGLVDYYRGMRFLLDGTLGAPTGFFAQNGGLDRFGRAYAQNIVQHNGGTADDFNDWDVFRVMSDGEEVESTHDSKTYELQSSVWTDISTTGRANDAFHIYTSIVNNQGVNATDNGLGGTYGESSAVEVTYDYVTFDVLSLLLGNVPNYYKIGAWLNLRFPYPHNTYNGVNTLGALWGNNATLKEPVTYDTNNMHFTHSGQLGFNVDEAEEHGPNNSLSFGMKLRWADGAGALQLEGNFKMRCAMYDTSDNVVTQDFVLSINDLWQDVALPIDNFQIYRARTPWRRTLDGTDPVYLLHDLDIVNSFQYQNIKMICFQTQESYNDEGQFVPEASRYVEEVGLTFAGKISLSIDRLHFTKALLAVTSPVTTGRSLTPTFNQRPLISNFKQLKQDAESWLEVTKFRHRQYDIKTEGRFDINLFDTFFLQKDDLVPDDDTRTADTGGNANTIRLVAKELTFKISKSSSEGSHFVRYITGIKRIIS